MKTFVLFVLIGSVCSLASLAEASSGTRASDLTYDIGISTGNYGNGSYTEANIGLNWFAQEWLAWRNAVFGRFQTDVENAYGLDSSARFIADVGTSRTGFTAFVGPGYRFATGTSSAPFAEEGLVFHLGGLSIGAGAKQVLDSWIHQGAANDNQYFIILGGGGSL